MSSSLSGARSSASNVIHAGIESFHHDETEEFAGIRDDNAVRIVWVILDGARKAQFPSFPS